MIQIKDRDWYKCFKEALYEQPGVAPDMDVSEAAEHVAKSNDFIACQLEPIKIAEAYGIGRIDTPIIYESELVSLTRMDLMSQDYMARYVSLKDKQFAKAAGKLPRRLLPGPRMRWCELYLFYEQANGM